jgi:sec-independent protein translocase protein TatC|tara:strand:- start:225 stop:1109 length:885 start_codon:yes stop_codon:yes gene_type:complete
LVLPAIALWRGAGFVLGKRLRNWIGLAVLVGLIVGVEAFVYSEKIIAFLIAPAEGRLSPFGGKLVYTGLTAGFGASISIASKGFVVGFVPTLAVGVLRLFRNTIPYRWWKYVVVFLTLSVFAFFVGLVFFYTVILPVMIPFLLRWNSGVAVPIISLNEYLEEVTQLGLAIGVMYILPIVVYLLAKADIVTYYQLKSRRGWIIVGLIVFSVAITPSLEGTLTALVFYPMYMLFEVGVFAAWVTHRDEGNYFADYFLFQWIWGLIMWILRRPIAATRWVCRKARWILWGFWLGERW